VPWALGWETRSVRFFLPPSLPPSLPPFLPSFLPLSRHSFLPPSSKAASLSLPPSFSFHFSIFPLQACYQGPTSESFPLKALRPSSVATKTRRTRLSNSLRTARPSPRLNRWVAHFLSCFPPSLPPSLPLPRRRCCVAYSDHLPFPPSRPSPLPRSMQTSSKSSG